MKTDQAAETERVDKLVKLVIYLLTPATNFPAGMVDIGSGTGGKICHQCC